MKKMSSRLAPVGVYLGHDTRGLIDLVNTGLEARNIGAANVFQTKCHVGANVAIPHHCSIGKQRSCMDVCESEVNMYTYF